MSDSALIIVLPLITFFLVVGLALWSKRATEAKEVETKADKSSLAKDGPGPQPLR